MNIKILPAIILSVFIFCVTYVVFWYVENEPDKVEETMPVMTYLMKDTEVVYFHIDAEHLGMHHTAATMFNRSLCLEMKDFLETYKGVQGGRCVLRHIVK